MITFVTKVFNTKLYSDKETDSSNKLGKNKGFYFNKIF